MKKQSFIAYYRVSTSKQGADGNGMQAQRQAVARYLASLECELIASFEEVESGANNQRPELTKAIALAKSKKAILVIAKLDRLSRNAAFLLTMQDAGIDFVCCDCPTADKFSVGILGLMAQRERELISQRTKAGLAIVKARGTTLGNPNPRKALKLAVAANQDRADDFAKSLAPVVAQIRKAHVTSLRGIAECLNARGFQTPNGKNFAAQSVKNLLERIDN